MAITQQYIARVPSNIAFLKYWGKKDPKLQWPTNNSLSMTLSCSHTTTIGTRNNSSAHKYYFANTLVEANSIFGKKVYSFIDYIQKKYDFKDGLTLRSSNNFPTGCGIASSASGFGALTLSAIATWTGFDTLEQLHEHGFSLDVLANLSRMGSGSSCRSFFGGYVSWLKGDQPLKQQVCSRFSFEHWKLVDLIVIISAQKKSVGSTEAHQVAKTSPLFPLRLASLNEREHKIIQAIEEKDLNTLGPILEQESLDIHSLVLSGTPRISYLSAQTIQFLLWLKKLRQEKNIQAYFTIDAGPNVHLICEPHTAETLREQIRKDYDYQIIEDKVGRGPSLSSIDPLEGNGEL
jgi:diphosphomevalonate decarboxylase